MEPRVNNSITLDGNDFKKGRLDSVEWNGGMELRYYHLKVTSLK